MYQCPKNLHKAQCSEMKNYSWLRFKMKIMMSSSLAGIFEFFGIVSKEKTLFSITFLRYGSVALKCKKKLHFEV